MKNLERYWKHLLKASLVFPTTSEKKAALKYAVMADH